MSSWPSKLHNNCINSHGSVPIRSSYHSLSSSFLPAVLVCRLRALFEFGCFWKWPGVTHLVQTTFGRSSRPAWSRQGAVTKLRLLGWSHMRQAIRAAHADETSGATMAEEAQRMKGRALAEWCRMSCRNTPQYATTYWPTVSTPICYGICIYSALEQTVETTR